VALALCLFSHSSLSPSRSPDAWLPRTSHAWTWHSCCHGGTMVSRKPQERGLSSSSPPRPDPGTDTGCRTASSRDACWGARARGPHASAPGRPSRRKGPAGERPPGPAPKGAPLPGTRPLKFLLRPLAALRSLEPPHSSVTDLSLFFFPRENRRHCL
jgi:hypothetical protein